MRPRSAGTVWGGGQGPETQSGIWKWIDHEMVWVRVVEDGDTGGAGVRCVPAH